MSKFEPKKTAETKKARLHWNRHVWSPASSSSDEQMDAKVIV